MVTQFGMSEVIGLMAVGDAEHEVFLGREIGHRRAVSEHTARQVDTEVKRILDEAHERARAILENETDLMERLAEALLERETLDHDEIQLLAEGKPLPPLEKLVIPGAPSNGAPLAEPKGLPAPEVEEEGEGAEEEEEARVSPLAHALDRKRDVGLHKGGDLEREEPAFSERDSVREGEPGGEVDFSSERDLAEEGDHLAEEGDRLAEEGDQLAEETDQVAAASRDGQEELMLEETESDRTRR
jgi:hypothetical protein